MSESPPKFFCKICSSDVDYNGYKHEQAGCCEKCAVDILNWYWHARSGKFLTWPNPKPEKPSYVKAPIPGSLRASVFERDGYKCQHCGSQKQLCCDHIKPEIKGGKAVLENLQTLCRSCNSKKKDRV